MTDYKPRIPESRVRLPVLPLLSIALLGASIGVAVWLVDWEKSRHVAQGNYSFIDVDYNFDAPVLEQKAFENTLREFARHIDETYFKISRSSPLRIVVVEDSRALADYFRRHGPNEQVPGFGGYLNGRLVMRSDSGLGTATSLMVPVLTERYFRDKPAWTGLAFRTFFEKIYGYWHRDGETGEPRIRFETGFFNPWRVRSLGSNLLRLNISRLVTEEPYGGYSSVQSKARLIAMFLWREDRFDDFVAAIRGSDLGGYDNYLEASFDAPMAEIEPLWRSFVGDVYGNFGQFVGLPGSDVYPDKAAMEAALEGYYR